MSKWIAEFELEDGDTMPEHMDLEYQGTRLDFHCKPKKIGHWIKGKTDNKYDYSIDYSIYFCSECGRNVKVIADETLFAYPYCHCGAKMEETEE